VKRFATILTVLSSLVALSAEAARAEVKVKLTNMHICCKGCTNGILKAVTGLDAVKVDVDQDAEETTVTGTDAAAVQKAVDAIAAAGYHATVVGDGVTLKPGDAPAGKVKSLKLANAHNCCGACNVAIRKALQTVPGVTGDSCKSKATEFEVTGDFDAKAVVAALEKAGFHVTVK
jgi:copper chaperone CopZ